nr:polyphosphate:AMP phosphotransferase [Myxococcota bacterium]
QLESLRVELLNLQFDLQSADFSVILLVAGDDRPGCVELLHALHECMDARYLETHVLFGEGSDEEQERPWCYRYWRRLPPEGRIGLFLGAWPVQVLEMAVDEDWDPLELDGALDHVERLERELALDGSLVLKFWLHLPKKVLEKRLVKAEKDPERHWRIEERDWEILENYDKGMPLLEHVVRRTNTTISPWQIVESTDHRYRNLTVARQLAAAIRQRLESGPAVAPEPVVPLEKPAAGNTVLDQIDLTASVDPGDYSSELDKLQARLNELSREACDSGVACVMAFEGSDAAGKGGAIRRVAKAMPVHNVRVIPVAAPTEEERARHYLWRFWRHIPASGRTVIFDRSWYGRVLVERVEGFTPENDWRRAYEEINEFEALLDTSGVPVIKFWLQIDADEQLSRFEARAQTPYKKYKLTEEDFRNREKWDLYQQAVHDMVTHTSTSYAPWTLVPANDKRYARLMVLRTVCERLAARLEAEKQGKDGDKKEKKKRKKNEKKKGDR